MNKYGMIEFEVIKTAKDSTGKEFNRRYEFLVPIGAPYQEIYDVAIEISKEIIEISKEAKEVDNKSDKNKLDNDKSIKKKSN